jgi:hypothetical protein
VLVVCDSVRGEDEPQLTTVLGHEMTHVASHDAVRNDRSTCSKVTANNMSASAACISVSAVVGDYRAQLITSRTEGRRAGAKARLGPAIVGSRIGEFLLPRQLAERKSLSPAEIVGSTRVSDLHWSWLSAKGPDQANLCKSILP